MAPLHHPIHTDLPLKPASPFLSFRFNHYIVPLYGIPMHPDYPNEEKSALSPPTTTQFQSFQIQSPTQEQQQQQQGETNQSSHTRYQSFGQTPQSNPLSHYTEKPLPGRPPSGQGQGYHQPIVLGAVVEEVERRPWEGNELEEGMKDMTPSARAKGGFQLHSHLVFRPSICQKKGEKGKSDD